MRFPNIASQKVGEKNILENNGTHRNWISLECFHVQGWLPNIFPLDMAMEDNQTVILSSLF